MRKSLQAIVMVAAMLLAGGSPCFTPGDGGEACPMSHCDRPPASSFAAPSCCCAPAGAPASSSTAPAVMEAFALAPHVTPAVPVSVATAAPVHSTTPVALHPPLPLYLLNSSLLI